VIPDLNWWGRLFGLLAVEAALIVAVAALLARWIKRPQVRRVVWQGCLIAVALVWLGELAGLRGQFAKLRPARPAERTLAVRLLDAPAREPLPESFPVEALSPLPALITPSRPVWWPGWLWLAGLTALTGRLVLTRAGLAWCVFKTRRERAGPSFREHGSNGGARRRASVLECVRLAAAFVRRMRARDVTAFVHSSKAVAPLRCTTALQDARALLPASSSAFALLEPSGTEAIVAQLRRRLGLGPVRVQVWPQLRGPVAFGIFRPTVALPVDFADRFTPKQREAMLAHELAHLAGRDPLWLALADIVCALAWWQPLVWWARRLLRAASEAAADEASALVPDGRVALAEALVNFGRELTASGGVGVSGSGLKSELACRVKALVSGGSGSAVRPAGHWLLRLGLAGVFSALLLGPLPGDPGGLGVVIAAVQARQADTATAPSAKTAKAEPQVRSVFTERAAAPEQIAGESVPPVRAGLSYEQPQPAAFHRTSSTYVALDPHGTGGEMVIPAFEFPGETLGEAVRRLTAVTQQADPERRGVSASFFESPGLEAVRIRPGPTLHNVTLDQVLATLVQAAESPIQSSLDSHSVLFAHHHPLRLEDQERINAAAQNLKTARLALEVAKVREAPESPALKAAATRHQEAERAFLALAKQTQLATRQFRLPVAGFTRHLQQFLPAGQTNLQFAVRAFCLTSGVEMPLLAPATTATSPSVPTEPAFFSMIAPESCWCGQLSPTWNALSAPSRT